MAVVSSEGGIIPTDRFIICLMDMTPDQPLNLPQDDVLNKLNRAHLRLEEELQRERLTRLIDRLREQNDIDQMHLACKMIIKLLYHQKAATNFFMKEAVNNNF